MPILSMENSDRGLLRSGDGNLLLAGKMADSILQNMALEASSSPNRRA